MAAVLGISADYHDAAAALVVDGRILAAVQQERLSRKKNDPSLPIDAARSCLAIGGITAGDLDAVVFYENPYAKLERSLVSAFEVFPRALRIFPSAMRSLLGHKVWVLDRLAEALDVPRARVEFVPHHTSHAASAFFTSGFEEAAVLTVDGVGEQASTAIFHGRGRELRLVESIDYPHSLGLLYAAITAFLGFEVNEGEYKVMGLAAYGRPTLGGELARIVRVDSDGGFALSLDCFAHHVRPELPFGRPLEAILGPARRPGKAWNLDDPADRHYADVAASLQAVTEEAMLALARRACARTGATRLCVAGGVALNAVAIARIEASLELESVYVPPGAGDAGGAIGAAILGAIDRGDPRPMRLPSAALGAPIDAARGERIARALGMDVERVADPPREIAARVARGEIIALATGRGEFGPRALGQRSILADARDVRSRERLNRRIKRREPFRPFAPAMRAEEASRHFSQSPSETTRFMTSVRRATEEATRLFPAVCHVDGTARVQTVEDDGTVLRAILDAMARITDHGIVLNTSLNGAGEPIAYGAEDALFFLARHSVDALFLEDLVITRERRGRR
jgi:carbamoyltransferase